MCPDLEFWSVQRWKSMASHGNRQEMGFTELSTDIYHSLDMCGSRTHMEGKFMACCNCRDALCVLHGPVPVICQGQLQLECLLWFTKHIWALLDLPACQELLHTQGSLSSHLITWKRSLKPCQTCLQSLNFVFGFLQLRGCRHLGLLQFSVKGRGEVRAEQRTHLCLADLGDGAIKCLNWDETTANTTQALRCFCGTLKCCHFVRCCSYFVVPLIKILTV